MRLVPIALSLLGATGALSGQSVVALADRQEIILKGQVLRRNPPSKGYTPIPDLPPILPGPEALGRVEMAWDGSKAYQVGFTPNRQWVAYTGTAFFTEYGDRRWFWAEPKVLPVKAGESLRLLGAWEDNLLLLLIAQNSKAKPQTPPPSEGDLVSQSLIRMDLITKEVTHLMDLQVVREARMTALFSQDAFYLFTATGKVVQVKVGTEPWSTNLLHSDFWREAGVTLCKDTGEFQNPFLFGQAFLDADGSILVPTQVFLPLERADIDLAWSKLPQTRKSELIQSGFWPVVAGKEVGWKDDVHFLRFDPSAKTFTQVPRSRFEHLVLEEDRNFMVRRFKVVEPSLAFTSDGDLILPLEQALQTSKAEPPLKEGKGAPKEKKDPNPRPQ
ncbi:MAG: hypothetical protein IPP58_15290 [Holophagaceae bacterium]|uniref:Uncharacterized protein n=1 Tax=Candidatus Geothrix skivensis TaxID=2954439 RepID=A0A9D7SHK2_9BACT|nr:hypothetical protein [Candidatus Geothrix skivensis]